MTASDRRPLIAVPKGRILEDIRPLFEEAGITLPDTVKESRRMLFDDPGSDFRFFMLRGSDVPTYVEAGVADIGIAGLDVLEENGCSFYMPVDLKVGACTMCVIGMEGAELSMKRAGRAIRVATKFPNIAGRYFSEQGIPVELIGLHGNIELAPMMGLADCVVDLVATGETLRKNGLKAYHRFLDVSARVVCNRASYRLRFAEFKPLFERLTEVVAQRS